MTKSSLDNVPGLGEVRRKALLRHFGSVRRLSAATVDEIAEVPGIGRRTAEAILAALGPEQPQPTAVPSPPAEQPSAAELVGEAAPQETEEHETPAPPPGDVTTTT
jgi:excinuclease ABC subunit C